MVARLAVVVSHPIQYHVPLYRRLASRGVVDLEVLYLSDHGVEPTYDEGFRRKVSFDVPLLGGYRSRFLRNWAPNASVSRPFGLVNPSLLRVLDDRSYDVVLVHGYASVSTWIAFARAFAGRLPLLTRFESWLDVEEAGPRSRRVIKRAVLGPVLRRAAACLAIGSRNRMLYDSYGVAPSRIFDTPYCVDNDHFASAGSAGRQHREEVLRAAGLDPTIPTVLFVGKLYELKRPLDLVAAHRTMTTPSNLAVIGDGPLRSEVTAALEGRPRTAVLGFLNQRTTGEWYGVADVVVVCSRRETWGLVVNEAMAAGAVVVGTTAIGCAPDLLSEQTGRTYDVGDVRALAGILDELCSDPDLRSMLRLNASRNLAHYSVDAAADGVEAAVLASSS